MGMGSSTEKATAAPPTRSRRTALDFQSRKKNRGNQGHREKNINKKHNRGDHEVGRGKLNKTYRRAQDLQLRPHIERKTEKREYI